MLYIYIYIIYVYHAISYMYNAEEIRHAYKSKRNFKCDNQVILLIITDGIKWHYLAVKKYLRRYIT